MDYTNKKSNYISRVTQSVELMTAYNGLYNRYKNLIKEWNDLFKQGKEAEILDTDFVGDNIHISLDNFKKSINVLNKLITTLETSNNMKKLMIISR